MARAVQVATLVIKDGRFELRPKPFASPLMVAAGAREAARTLRQSAAIKGSAEARR